jgi:hypothetical protein
VSGSPPETPSEPGDTARDDPPALDHRLDPDLAARAAAPEPPRSRPPVIDTRRYRWAIGILGVALVIFISIYQFASNGVRTAGVPPGKGLQFFSAPLADSTLRGDANLHPPCSLAHHDPRALNVCLLVQRAPLAIAFFVPDSEQCKRQVDALQAISHELPPGSVQFAAVAVRASQAQTRAIVRAHRWKIPVAYDADGAVGGQYGVAICPLLELAYRGGIVKDRLIGDHWTSQAALAPRVKALSG